MADLETLQNQLGLESAGEPLQIFLEWLTTLEGTNRALARILTGQDPATGKIAKAPVRSLEEAIIEASDCKRTAYEQQLAFLVWVDAGNAAGVWEICPPRIPTWTPSPVSPHGKEQRQVPGQFRAIREALHAALQGPAFDKEPEAEIGMLFLSAILNGSLHATPLLDALARKMGTPLHAAGIGCWLDLELTHRKQIYAQRRRWFIDPVSELLFIGLSPKAMELAGQVSESTGWPSHRIWKCIRMAWKAWGLPRHLLLGRLTKLLEMCAYRQRLEGPAYLTPYNGNAFVSHSLRPAAWRRLLGLEQEPEAHSDAEGPAVVDPHQMEAEGVSTKDDLIESPWYRQLRQAVDVKQDAAKARNNLGSLASQAEWQEPGIRQHLLKWMLFMLEKGAQSGHKPQPSTLTQYLGIAGKRLAASLTDEPIQSFSAEEFNSLYGEVLEEAFSSGHRHKIGQALREFHHYLSVTHAVVPHKDIEALDMGVSLTPVDANVLGLEEYRACLAELRRYPPLVSIHEDAAEAAALIVTIAFRAGTRRMEVLCLRTEDLHVTDLSMELLIRPWYERRLKTKSSTRMIPLHALLDHDEQQQLRRWHARRLEQEKKGPFSPQLFAIPEAGMRGLTQEFLYPKLHRVMRHVTSDPTVRFHHLRHSFATWTTLRLYLSTLPEVPELFPHLPQTRAWLKESLEFRHRLYGHAQLTRKDLHAVSSLLGHAAPDMSLEHYIHCLDVIARLNRERKQDEKTILAIAHKIGSVPQRTIYHHGVQKNLQGLLELIREKCPERVQCISPQTIDTHGKTLAADTSLIDEETDLPALERIQAVWVFLSIYGKQPGYPFKDLCERCGLSVDLARRYLDRAEYIRNLTSGLGQNLRHREQTLFVEDQEIRGLAPEWPRNKSDLDMMQRLSNPLWQLLCNPKQILADDITIGQVLDFYIEHARRTKHELVFHYPRHTSLASAYLALIDRLGLGKDEIQVYRFSQEKKISGVWRKRVPQLKGYQFIDAKPPNSESRSLDQAIAVKVIDPTLYAGNAGSQGFRVLMHLAVIMGYD